MLFIAEMKCNNCSRNRFIKILSNSYGIVGLFITIIMVLEANFAFVFIQLIFHFLYLNIYVKTTPGLVPISYRGALLSSLLHVNVYVTHNLLNVLVEIANKMGLNNTSVFSSKQETGTGD
jgi:hypothetical protein